MFHVKQSNLTYPQSVNKMFINGTFYNSNVSCETKNILTKEILNIWEFHVKRKKNNLIILWLTDPEINVSHETFIMNLVKAHLSFTWNIFVGKLVNKKLLINNWKKNLLHEKQ